MSHVDDGTLHALVDHELDAQEAAVVEAHLSVCDECAHRFVEATAMSRQVLSLLGSLDVVPTPVRTVPSAVSAVVTPVSDDALPVMPISAGRARMTRLRRLAIAASVLLVAGVSYEVGKRGDSRADGQPAASVMPATQSGAANGAMPSVVSARADSTVVALSQPNMQSPTAMSASPRRLEARAADARSSETVVAGGDRRVAIADASPRARAAEALPMEALVAAPAPAQARALGMAKAVPAAEAANAAQSELAPSIPGYTRVDDASARPVIRRRYLAPDGTALELLVAPSREALRTQASGAEAPRAGVSRYDDAKATSEFVVSTANGRSTVRWQRRGLSYELQSALAPDSLVKLAMLLR